MVSARTAARTTSRSDWNASAANSRAVPSLRTAASGLVRRLGWALDPRSFKVHPIAAPDEHERAQHYLQSFWRQLPEKEQIVAFDRSWYGRVLVERVEGIATKRGMEARLNHLSRGRDAV